MTDTYESQAARDASRTGYGDSRYWQALDDSERRSRDYYRARGDHASAERVMTRSLGEALEGNNGD